MTPIHWPGLWDGEFGQIVGQAHALAFALADFLRRHGQSVPKQGEAFPRLSHVEADVGFHHGNHSVADFGLVAGAKSSEGPVVASKRIHEERDGRDRTVGQPRLFKEDGGTVVLDQEVGDRTRLVDDINRSVDS